MRTRPLLVYDGDCGFCMRWVDRWRRRTGDAVDYAPAAEVLDEFPEISTQAFAEAVHLIEPDGRVRRGAEAVCATLEHDRWLRLPARLLRLPGIAALAEAGYRWVANHRQGLSRLEALLIGRRVTVSAWSASRRIALVALAAVTILAFASLWMQLDGLIGSEGIWPAARVMDGYRDQLGGDWWRAPTLFWLGAGDTALHAACAAGIVLSVLLLFDLAPAACLVGMWALYLSFLPVAGPFLQFQWDTLLLETLLLAVFYAPWRWRRGRAGDPAPPALARWLLWWLVFRFMFESGVVKITYADPAWLDLSALTYHYWTQPLPHLLSVYAHRLPLWFHELSAGGMFFVELAVPFAILGPRRIRHAAALALIGLQVVIGATGNYGFFNLLTAALCLNLIDDQAWTAVAQRLWRRGGRAESAVPSAAGTCGLTASGLLPWSPSPPCPRMQRVLIGVLALVALSVGTAQLHDLFDEPRRVTVEEREAGMVGAFTGLDVSLAVRLTEERAAAFHVVNAYGLFRIMTKTRPEILIQGSNDGETWVDYEFRWKPDRLDERPSWVQPHMPRLDWRLWFEALAWEPVAQWRRQPYQPSLWFGLFLERLLEGSPAVGGLLGSDPFPGAPPRFIRAGLFSYTFAELNERSASGAWWERRRLDPNWFRISRPDR